MKTSEKIIIVIMILIVMIEFGIVQHSNGFMKVEEGKHSRSSELNGKTNPEYDTVNLRFDAEYEAEVAEGVFWVPANTLGMSHMSNSEMETILNCSPEEKQNKVSNLYEAIQLYQVGGFCFLEDTNKQLYEQDILWEYHIPGKEAVRINGGNCSTSSSWLNYILEGDYQELGYIAFSQDDGNGHVWNYIYDGEYYYFIDLTHYRLDYIYESAVETGALADYRYSDRIGGSIHKASSIESYLRYCFDVWNNPPELICSYQGNKVPDIGLSMLDNKTTIYYPKEMDVEIVYDIPEDLVNFQVVDFPEYIVDWADFPSHGFETKLPFE